MPRRLLPPRGSRTARSDGSALTHPSFAQFWAEVTADAHPPAFYMLLRGAWALKWDFVWLRGITAVFAALAVWAFWLVGRELGRGGRAGAVSRLVCAAIVALNPELIVLSQIMRPYMILLALLALALFHLLRYRTDPRRRHLVGYAAYTTVALLTHYSAALALAAFWPWLWSPSGVLTFSYLEV